MSKKCHRLFPVMLSVLLITFFLSACSSSSIEESTETANTPAESNSQSYEFDAGALSYLGLERNELLEIYTAFGVLTENRTAGLEDASEIKEAENQCAGEIAESFGIAAEDVIAIFATGSEENYFATFDVNNVALKYGDAVSVSVWGSEIVIKAKISASYDNEATVAQNYYNVCDFIRNYAKDDYTAISYWAVADMTSGSEEKVVSFDLSESIIETISSSTSSTFADNTLSNYVENLYIHPSLQE